MINQIARPIAAIAPSAAPTPMPAFAPVDKPLLLEPSSEEVASAAPGVLIEVSWSTVVDAETPVTMDVIVMEL